MREVVGIGVDEVGPSIRAVLRGQGVPEEVTLGAGTMMLAEQTIDRYRGICQPTGLLMEVSDAEFESVYRGEGGNADETPLEEIYPLSDSLALFAVTVGGAVSEEISRLFAENEFAEGAMLDSAASESAEMAAQVVESRYVNLLKQANRLDSGSGVLRFSPGYCGWNITAQRKLFAFLEPGEIGITLGESCLMQPLKSVSGVIVAGRKEIFEFDDNYPFCRECETRSCRARIQAVREQ
jgi:hypothetical protein